MLKLCNDVNNLTGTNSTTAFTNCETQVLIDKTTDLDRMLGVENKQYVDKFVLGLDYACGFSAALAAVSGSLIYLFRNKRKKTK